MAESDAPTPTNTETPVKPAYDPATHDNKGGLTAAEAVRRYHERMAKQVAGLKPRLTEVERKERNQRNIAKAREALNLKIRQREMVKEKIAMGLPITAEERALATWKANQDSSAPGKIDDIAAKLEIKPQNLSQLRLVIEQTAARHNYNPIEGLIKLANDPETPIKEQMAIHKALLPYLAPTLSPVRQKDEGSGDSEKVVVKVTQFVFDRSKEKPETPIHVTQREDVPTMSLQEESDDE